MESLFRAILGVSAKASEEEVRRAYQVLAIRLHPIQNSHHNLTNESFHQLSDAHEALRERMGMKLAAVEIASAPDGRGWSEGGEHVDGIAVESAGLLGDPDTDSGATSNLEDEILDWVVANARPATSHKRPRSWTDEDNSDTDNGGKHRSASALRAARYRAGEDAERRTKRLASAAARAVRRRAEETSEKRARRMAADAARAARKRTEEGAEQREARRAADAARAARNRAEENLERRETRLAAQAARAAQRRAEEDAASRARRRASDAARAARKRADEHPEMRAKRLAADAARAARRRAAVRAVRASSQGTEADPDRNDGAALMPQALLLLPEGVEGAVESACNTDLGLRCAWPDQANWQVADVMRMPVHLLQLTAGAAPLHPATFSVAVKGEM